jgi:hypothetical protein
MARVQVPVPDTELGPVLAARKVQVLELVAHMVLELEHCKEQGSAHMSLAACSCSSGGLHLVIWLGRVGVEHQLSHAMA